MYEYLATPVRVVDGDTVDVAVDLGFRIGMTMRLRLYGINAPEMKTPAGAPAKAHLADLIESSLVDGRLLIHTQKDRTEKYGRYLATLFAPNGPTDRDGDPISINDLMVAHGHAVPYLL